MRWFGEKFTAIAVVVLTASLAAHELPAQEPAKQNLLVVQTLATDGGDKKLSLLARDLTEALVVHTGALSKPHNVLVRSETETRLFAQHMKDLSDLRPEDCHKLESCLARLFEGEASALLRGTLGRLADELVVTLKLIDVATGGVVRAESCAAETEEELLEAMKRTATAVLGYANAAPSQPEVAIPSDGRRIGVLPIGGSEAERRNVETLTEMLGVSILEFGFSPQTKGDLISMINFATDRQSLSGASLTDAIMEIAQSSGVSMLVSGSVGRIEKTHLIVLKLIDLHSGNVVNRVLESYIGGEANLGAAMRYACARLFGRAPAGMGGPVSIVTDVEGQYRIDLGRAETLPQVSPKSGLEAGKHQLTITSDGFFPYYADLYLSQEPLRFRAELEPLPDAWYESPLFLTIAGVVAAGTAAAIVIAVVPNGADSSGRLE
jgi:TolB-like protein